MAAGNPQSHIGAIQVRCGDERPAISVESAAYGVEPGDLAPEDPAALGILDTGDLQVQEG